MNYKNLVSYIILLTGMIFVFLNFNACEKNAPFESTNPEITSGEIAIQSNIGTVYIPKLKPQFENILAKPGQNDSIFFKKKKIKAKKGGKIILGNDFYGKSKIVFKKGALKKDLKIAFEWRASQSLNGFVGDAVFGPHGSQFKKPVKVVLSYKAVDLTGIDEDDLKFFYYDEENEIWILQDGHLNKRKKQYISHLKHFSRYAVAYGK